MDFLAVPDDLSHLGPALHDERASSSTSPRSDLAERRHVDRQGQRDLHRRTRPTSRRSCASSRSRSPRAQTTRFEKAVALQNWFREDGGFSTRSTTRRGQRVRRADRVPHRRTGRTRGLLRAVRLGDGRDGPASSASPPGSRSASSARPRPARTPGSTAPTTCTPGPSSTSTAPAGCASSPPRPAARRGRADVHPSDATPRGRALATSPQPGSADGAVRRPTGPTESPAAAAGAEDDSGSVTGIPWLPALGGLLVIALVGRRAAAPPRPCAPGGASGGSRPATRSRSGPSCATPRSTSACRGRAVARRGRPATCWSTTSAPR